MWIYDLTLPLIKRLVWVGIATAERITLIIFYISFVNVSVTKSL